MKYQWIDEYLLAKPAVIKDFKKEWNWIRYRIGGKMRAVSYTHLSMASISSWMIASILRMIR